MNETNGKSLNGHAVPSPLSETVQVRPSKRGRRLTGATWWRARLIQPGKDAFFCTAPFLAVGEDGALIEACVITGRKSTELEVVPVSAPDTAKAKAKR